MAPPDALNHICVLCNSKLESKEALQEHFRKHANKEIDSKGRPGKPTVPPNKGVKPAASNRVSKLSNKPGEITCDVCGQEFDNVTVAIQHKFRKHPESAAKHFCPYCGMQFPLKYNRDKHLLDHPGGAPSKLYPCPDCGVVFYNEDAQAYHTKSTHKRDLIKCTTCDALFYNKKAYDNHNMYHKPDDLYVTSEEQRLQTVSRVDQDFDIRRVQNAAEKFIPVYRPRVPLQKKKKKGCAKLLKEDATDELSPNSAPESSDSDSDIPLLVRWLNKHRGHKSVSDI
ncbi:zinc finger and BTB domain-containing protein 40 isoform X2 [Anabrus simplex]|uniref:zinc finger and BTB domain-containing protein 40 isoform X2 n=1 Tax=Anabrus simplex TaxID=316456 RepID=UPI0034DCDD17